MKVKTRFFGTIEVSDDKLITMDKGMIGYPDLRYYALIFDEDKGVENSKIMWLQSMEDGDIAFPVMLPTQVMEDYAPNVNEEMIEPLGTLTPENTYMLVTVTVPKKVSEFTVNLKAPVIINIDERKGLQLIVEDDYPIRLKAYDLLTNKKKKAGEPVC